MRPYQTPVQRTLERLWSYAFTILLIVGLVLTYWLDGWQ